MSNVIDLSTIGGFLVFLGMPAFVNWLISNGLDKWDKYEELSPARQNIINLVISLILALLSYFLTHALSPEFWAQIQPVYSVIAAVLVAWFNGQIQHQMFARGVARMAAINYQVTLIAVNEKRIAGNLQPLTTGSLLPNG